MRYLNDTDHQAVQMAGELQQALQRWMAANGVDGTCSISPYVDPSGQPSVLIRMNAHVAGAIVAGLHELSATPNP